MTDLSPAHLKVRSPNVVREIHQIVVLEDINRVLSARTSDGVGGIAVGALENHVVSNVGDHGTSVVRSRSRQWVMAQHRSKLVKTENQTKNDVESVFTGGLSKSLVDEHLGLIGGSADHDGNISDFATLEAGRRVLRKITVMSTEHWGVRHEDSDEFALGCSKIGLGLDLGDKEVVGVEVAQAILNLVHRSRQFGIRASSVLGDNASEALASLRVPKGKGEGVALEKSALEADGATLGKVGSDGHGAGGLAGESDLVGVTAEETDVGLHPLHGQFLIH